MKTFLAIASAALLVAGCNQGGTGDDYNAGSGTETSASTNYSTGSSQGGASSPSGVESGMGASSTNLNNDAGASTEQNTGGGTTP